MSFLFSFATQLPLDDCPPPPRPSEVIRQVAERIEEENAAKRGREEAEQSDS